MYDDVEQDEENLFDGLPDLFNFDDEDVMRYGGSVSFLEREHNREPDRQRIQKLDAKKYENANNSNTLVPDLIEKINELIMRIDLIDAKCDGQTKVMRTMQTEIENIKKGMLI